MEALLGRTITWDATAAGEAIATCSAHSWRGLHATFGAIASGHVSRGRRVDSNKFVLWKSNRLILVFRDKKRVAVDQIVGASRRKQEGTLV